MWGSESHGSAALGAMEAAPAPMFAMLSPDETALDVVRRARKATVRTGFPPLDPVRQV